MLKMDYPLELNKANRLTLAQAFRNHKRVDFSIDCVVEGQMGKAFVDDPKNPTAFRITTGPFWYCGGDAAGHGARQMMRDFPAYHLLMPAPPEWVALARDIFGERLEPFSAAGLSMEHLVQCLQDSSYRDRIIAIDVEMASRLAQQPESYFEIAEFDSPQDFVERGMGYLIFAGNEVMGVAYSSLVCSSGIEVSIYVAESHRQKGVATALGCRLLLECLDRGLRPNWDAANRESFRLAKRLGYTFVATYDAFYHTA